MIVAALVYLAIGLGCFLYSTGLVVAVDGSTTVTWWEWATVPLWPLQIVAGVLASVIGTYRGDISWGFWR